MVRLKADKQIQEIDKKYPGFVQVVAGGGVVWRGVVWCGVVWCGVVWCGVVWCSLVWCGVVWCVVGAGVVDVVGAI